ncbi:MAG: TerC family protein [Gemmataceae bacterium]|nr:TerC family protein [Gemmataceae bacterium]
MKLRLFLLIGFVALAAFSLAADDSAPEVTAQTTDRRVVTGVLHNKTIRLKTEYGIHEIKAEVVQRLTFSPGEEPGHDVVEFTDGHHVRGELMSDKIQIEANSVIESFGPGSLREIKLTKRPELSLGAIIMGLVMLSVMEIVLGIDNIIFLAIVAGKLPEKQQPKARRIGLVAALGTRILLLLSLSFLLGLTEPIFIVPDLPYFHDLEAREVSWRDLILLGGGLFLLCKSVREMHEKFESARSTEDELKRAPKVASFGAVLLQIAVLDIVFSLDSVVTAVGMVDEVWVMIVAMVVAMLVMLAFAGAISNFVDRHPTIKMLALAFLILIGVMLVAESLGQHINKGYIYFAMAFAVVIEMVNIRLRRPAHPTGT